jgi:hypothetical protein
MTIQRNDVRGPDLRGLWAEALWAVGLLGGVLALVGFLVIAFGH